MGDVIRIIANTCMKISSEDNMRVIIKPFVERLVFDQLKLRSAQTIKQCCTIIGQNIAIYEGDFKLLEYIEQGLLDELQWVLLQTNAETRKEAIWVLQNLACSQASVEKIFQHKCLIPNLLIEIKKHEVTNKAEAAQFFSNLIYSV